MLATDVDFGPDGGLYFCDWVEGWNKPNKGRIYRVGDPARRSDSQVREVRAIIKEGMAARSLENLAGLLAHSDMRVRQEAQFELAGAVSPVGKRSPASPVASGKTLPRIHAIWGLGQAARAAGAGQNRGRPAHA